ncbi:Classical arabinogalactan protein 26 [Heracleum sosnowskyi]|uniref:Classical arabinogalactan protein 26 n=1 Tax=Heracleum sosnowskyi TaxID=360622 RepID=A0AAD8GRZ2_9APIA|nr:Classical arabinogalactan protein 26 [Heracleum sosnowskyi]
MAAKWSIFLGMTMVLMASIASSQLPISVISAAPSVLPFEPPLSSPPATSPSSSSALSPDITPLFPTPAGPSPAQSSLPLIPSSRSPPNPDEVTSPGPIMALQPSGLFPDSSAFTLHALGCPSSVILLLSGLVQVFSYCKFLGV